MQKVADASGSKYSAGSSASAASSGPPPPVASKPAFNPTRSSAASGFNPLASSRSRPGQNNNNVDEDGWGADAPQVTRSQLEKVAPAYQPTKVNMAELTKQKEPSRFNGSSQADDNTGAGVVKGGYQPVGKVDIAALRAQAQKTSDDRPTIVKGAYEPVGKVDIAAIRARAQKPSDDGAGQLSPIATGASATSNTSDEPAPKSLADRSSAFTPSERLTSLPKPKIANRFGSSASNFSGTKAPTPGAFGLQSAPTVASPPVGAAKTYADEDGKTPAQIWAEKKARQRGLSGAGNGPSATSPIASQTSGGGEWKSGYSGKSWAPVATNATGRSGADSIGQQRTGEEEREEEAPSSPAGGVGALRDRFKGGAPMGAPSIARDTTGEQSPPPPPVNSSNRPTGGVPMPGLPSRPRPADEEEEEEQDGPNIPPPPRVPRSPTPPTPEERDTSPVRIAMPVARSKETEIEAPEERNDPPALPTQIGHNVPDEEDLTEEPVGHDPARGAGAAVAAASFSESAATTHQESGAGAKRALVQYDYEKAEDNELELVEGEYVTNIEMVDDDWWMGINQKGESGLFPSNYVELVEGEEEEEAPAPVSHAPEPVPAMAPRPAAAPAAPSGPTAKALYDYEAAEDNELSFPEEATVTGLVSSSMFRRALTVLTSSRNSPTKIGGLVIMRESRAFSRPITCNLTSELPA